MILAAAAPANAQPCTLELDPAETRIEYTLADVLHTVHGTFRLKRGTLRFDPETGKADGLIEVDAASGDSGSAARDRRMKRNVLETQRYREITFRPTAMHGRLAAEGESKVEVVGRFGLHGAEHDITVPAVVRISGGRLTADLQFAVPYVAWGLKDPSTFVLRVGKEVGIRLHTSGRLSR